MEVKATAKYVRMSPRKVRLVAALVRGKKLASALDQLSFADKAAALPVKKVLTSAAANAKHNFEIAEDNLYIKEIRVDEGPTLSRWLPRAHGRATPLRKRMSHIKLTLAEITDSGLKKGRQTKVEAPIKLGAVTTEDKGVKVAAPAEAKPTENLEEKDKQIIDPRREGRRGHARVEGGKKGFVSRIFHRKSG